MQHMISSNMLIGNNHKNVSFVRNRGNKMTFIGRFIKTPVMNLVQYSIKLEPCLKVFICTYLALILSRILEIMIKPNHSNINGIQISAKNISDQRKIGGPS